MMNYININNYNQEMEEIYNVMPIVKYNYTLTA